MANIFEENFYVNNVEIEINQNSIEFEEWEDADVDDDGYVSRYSGYDAYATGTVKATVTYLPTDQEWETIWTCEFGGVPEGYESYAPSWDDPGSTDWDSIEWNSLECEELEFEDNEGDCPDILNDKDGNEDFEEAWRALENKVYKAVEEQLPFEE